MAVTSFTNTWLHLEVYTCSSLSSGMTFGLSYLRYGVVWLAAYYLLVVFVLIFSRVLMVGSGDIEIYSTSLLLLGSLVFFCGLVSSRITCGSITLCAVAICARVSLYALGLFIISTLSGSGPCLVFYTTCFWELCMVNISASLCSADNFSSPNLWKWEAGLGFHSACVNSPAA